MNPFETLPLTEGRIRWAIKQSKSMTQASKIIGCSFTTFKKYAKLYNLWNPNQAGRGIPKKRIMKNTSEINFDNESWERALKELNMK